MIWDDIASTLAARAADGLTRVRRTIDAPCGPEAVVDGQALLGFCSNDYLGLAKHPALIAALQEGAARWGVGSGASHLVSGHLRPHQQLEEQLADWLGFGACLTLSTGYMANLAIVPTLVGRGDAVFADRLNHASLIDAVQLSRAEHRRYPHNDLDALARLLAQSTARHKLILSDAVFSMDGDLAPLPELFALAEQHDAWLVLDDAHGFGVLGAQGRGSLAHFGLAAHPRLILMGTLGKAAGAAGAFIAADRRVIDLLLQQARSYIFTTAASPALACALLASLELIAGSEGDARRARLHARIAQLQAGLPTAQIGATDAADASHNPTHPGLLASPTAIQPYWLGSNHAALAAQEQLQAAGLWVPAIRPPTVPPGSARLRITLSAAHSEAQLQHLLSALQGLKARA